MEYIKKIVVLIMIYNILSMLIVSESYQKYYKLLSGMILILIVFEPLHKIMNVTSSQNQILRTLSEFELSDEHYAMEHMSEEIEKQQIELVNSKTAECLRQMLWKQNISVEDVIVECEFRDREIIYKKILIKDKKSDHANTDYMKNLITEYLKLQDSSIIQAE